MGRLAWTSSGSVNQEGAAALHQSAQFAGKVRETFRGKVVNKVHTINTGVDEFPRYVVEYLIDNYCSEETFAQDMERIVRRLRENFVHGAEAEKIRHFIREHRRHSLIANLEVRLVETEDKYWGTISAINENFVNVPESLVRQYPMLLSGGMWGTIDLTYDETAIYNKKIRPFTVVSFTPFQVSVINLEEYIGKRAEFATEEWIDLLVNSCGLDPERMRRREKLLYLCRCLPLVENNVNMVELAPRETGKTYLYRNVSYLRPCPLRWQGHPRPALHQPQQRPRRRGGHARRRGLR